jgi:glycosyltransferase involved in cell wall biosynthesis
MDLTIAIEHRFMRTPDGAVWTATGLARRSWSRYLGAFDRVRILARVQHVATRDPRWLRVDGDRVEVEPLPYYVGPGEFLRQRRAVDRAIRAGLAAYPEAAVILRVPGVIGWRTARHLQSSRRPFGAEVVADPHDGFAPGAIDHPLRPLFRWWFTRHLRNVCASSSGTLYVTSAALQGRYPPAPGAASFSASDVELDHECFVEQPRGRDAPAGPPFRIITVGTLAQLYKRPQLLIQSISRCAAWGLDVTLVIVGDGQFRAKLEQMARRLGVAQRVRFAGHLPSGEAVRRELDQAHLFILSSRQEGMPRAMIEAMARGLPCLGTPVGGIPELLPSSALISADPDAIGARIREVARSPALRAEMSRSNLARAHEFDERALQPTREAFYSQLIGATAEYAGRRRTGPSNFQTGLAARG